MGSKNKNIIIVKRLFIWILYLYAGFILYAKKGYLFPFIITFAKVIYPLSIFWLQIRIKTKDNFLPIDETMRTSQLWFNILPVLASFITVIITILNVFLYLTYKLI
ncbi:hypothetical protein P9515_10741 [Prochlorococcus marinus str. MIT 9515]|uniref:Uncharacterized protein n=1 Tax=Prochlorococcus marinus (strain MIT 9515) TaxID=167542 RepID=A2BWX0_PROM5|nr:hypothetical protein [Prochlorococcus marinus]ABM72281.1 hypothetical protein P9515_10741 [Prochlorococcus marinus str. MIT 9515]